MEQRESAARQALRKKRARKRAVRTAVFLAVWVRDGLAFSLQSQQGMTAEAILAAAQSVK